MRLSIASGIALWLFLSAGCSQVALPTSNATPTRPPTQVPLPTRVTIVVPTPTIANLFPPGDTSEAVIMLRDFIEATSKGNIDGAMSYWNTTQSTDYKTNVRKLVQEWIDHKRQLVLTEITYLGVDATGKSVPMPASDPRVEQATARVRIDGVDYRFNLIQLKGGWFIEGVNTK